MLRLLTVALLFSSSFVYAQTTLDITLQGGGTCSYVTGPVSNGSSPGHLQATATSESGSGCSSGGTGSVTFGPASPAVAAPASLTNNTGTSSINFQVLNADTCVGTFNPSTGASFTGGSTLCSKTGSTQCSSPISAIANFDNETGGAVTYGVTVTCNGTAGQAVSTTSVVVPAHIVSNCAIIANSAPTGQPFMRATTAVWGPYNGTPTSQDATSFVKAFGDSTYPNWPGHPGLLQQFVLPSTSYISLAFTVPSTFYTGVNQNSYGSYRVSISGYTAPISMSISTNCGDFSSPGSSGSSVVCRGNLLIGNGTSGITYGNGQECPLTDGQSYFLNFINADVKNVTATGGTATTSANSKCTGGKCTDVFTNAPNSWQ